MSTMLKQAQLFFEACETGKGWDGCRQYCHEGASFSSQTGALAGMTTLEAYCNWMRDLFVPVPDGHYEIRCIGVDEARNTVAVYAIFHGTQTGPGGPGGPTGKTIAADYVYAMTFDGDRISAMTKIWNDTISLQQLGWA